jgi:hypothetical protein
LAGRKANEDVATIFIGNNGALRSGGGTGDGNLRPADRQALWVGNRSGKGSGINLRGAAYGKDQNQ